MGKRGVRRWRLAGLAGAALVALAGIALLASAGETSERADPRVASVEACARTPAPDVFARLPLGVTVAPLDVVIADAVVEQLSLPAEIARHLDARELDRGDRRLAGVLIAPVGNERASVAGAFAARGSGLPSTVALGRTGGTLIELEVAGRHVAAVLAFVGCRALVVGARDAVTARSLAGVLVRGAGR